MHTRQKADCEMSSSAANKIIDGLMERYRERVPDVGAIIERMMVQGLIRSAADIENDHIAFRTMGVPHLGIRSLEKVFLHHGWVRRDFYHFPEKKLDAWWYSPPTPRLPRIFISELKVDLLTPDCARIIRCYTDEVSSDPVDEIDLDRAEAVVAFLHRGLWRTPTWADWQRLSGESEYAAWVIYNRYYLNHFTISVHNLPAPWDTVAKFNEFLLEGGFRLNDSGGLVKTSRDGLLLQSSTVARRVDATFDDGHGGTEVHAIPGSYVEFAERRVLPEHSGLPPEKIGREHRRDGFEAGNADRIFESTYRQQTDKR